MVPVQQPRVALQLPTWGGVSLAHPAQQRRYAAFWWWLKDKVKLNQIRNGGRGQGENRDE